MPTQVEALKAGFAHYFKTEEDSDCTIVCGPYHFKVHKFLIGSHSEYFRTALKANTFKEGKTGTIELKATEPDSDDPEDACDDPEIVKLMVHYFYHLDYFQDGVEVPDVTTPEEPAAPPPRKKTRTSAASSRARKVAPGPPQPSSSPPQPSLPPTPKVHLIEHAKLFAMAVKYRVDALRDLAAQKFKDEVAQHWNHEDFAHAIHLIYTTTVDDVTQLREVAAEALYNHSNELLEKAEITALLRSINGLACDLYMRDRGKGRVNCNNVEMHGSRHWDYTCEECGCTGKFCGICSVRSVDFKCRSCGAEI